MFQLNDDQMTDLLHGVILLADKDRESLEVIQEEIDKPEKDWHMVWVLVEAFTYGMSKPGDDIVYVFPEVN